MQIMQEQLSVYYRHSVTVDLFAFLAIYSDFHPVGIGCACFIEDEGDLPSSAINLVGGLWVSHAFSFEFTVSAMTDSPSEEDFVITLFVFHDVL